MEAPPLLDVPPVLMREWVVLLLLLVMVVMPFEEDECPRKMDLSTFMDPSEDGAVAVEEG